MLQLCGYNTTWYHGNVAKRVLNAIILCARKMSPMNNQRKAKNPHIGSSLDDFLKEESIFEEAQTRAVKEVTAWQLKKAKKKRKRTVRDGRA